MKSIVFALVFTLAAATRAETGPEEKLVHNPNSPEPHEKALASIEKAAIESEVFKSARETLRQQLHRPVYVSRTVFEFGGMKTFHPGSTYLVFERWYGFDVYANLIAEVLPARHFPRGGKPTVRMQKIAPVDVSPHN
jgi:hypothetical protein